MLKTEINWIDCKDCLPTESKDYLVIVKEWNDMREKWEYDIDLAWLGTYIDDFWDTCNDWCEGQEVHITHWAEIEVPKKLTEKEGK